MALNSTSFGVRKARETENKARTEKMDVEFNYSQSVPFSLSFEVGRLEMWDESTGQNKGRSLLKM